MPDIRGAPRGARGGRRGPVTSTDDPWPEFRLLIGDAPTGDPVADFVGPPRRPHPDRPWVMANVVASADGATALAGESRELSGPADRAVFHALRAIADAVMAGAATVRADRYGPFRTRPDVADARRRRGQAPTAPVVVVSRSLDLDWESPLFTEAEVPTIVAAPEDAPTSGRAAAGEAGDLVTAGTGGVDVAGLVAELGRRGLSSVLCEGGPGMFAQLADADLLDELFLAISPQLVAGGAQRVLPGAPLVPPLALRIMALLEADGFLFVRYEVVR
jgi:riboflavin biosynthesis pyrimidine reductase